MLTVDFHRFPVRPGERVLDLGCGFGRHAFAALRHGAHVVAVDRAADEVQQVRRMVAAMRLEGELGAGQVGEAARGDLTALPFADGAFDVVIASEVLEHVPDDAAAVREIARVLRPGGRLAVTVPRYWPERVCWALSESYHDTPGGHVRIYTGDALAARLREAGLQPGASHHAHALHAPYWWLNCALGERSAPSRLYHRMLVWDIVSRPALTRAAERALNPVLGKSLVRYATKPASTGSPTVTTARGARAATAANGAASVTAARGARAVTAAGGAGG